MMGDESASTRLSNAQVGLAMTEHEQNMIVNMRYAAVIDQHPVLLRIDQNTVRMLVGRGFSGQEIISRFALNPEQHRPTTAQSSIVIGTAMSSVTLPSTVASHAEHDAESKRFTRAVSHRLEEQVPVMEYSPGMQQVTLTQQATTQKPSTTNYVDMAPAAFPHRVCNNQIL